MHKAIAITAIGVLSVSQALAGFEVEDSVFRIDKLQQAKEKAEAEGLPITFMYSNAQRLPVCSRLCPPTKTGRQEHGIRKAVRKSGRRL